MAENKWVTRVITSTSGVMGSYLYVGGLSFKDPAPGCPASFLKPVFSSITSSKSRIFCEPKRFANQKLVTFQSQRLAYAKKSFSIKAY